MEKYKASIVSKNGINYVYVYGVYYEIMELFTEDYNCTEYINKNTEAVEFLTIAGIIVVINESEEGNVVI